MELINYSFIIPHHNTPDLLQRCIDSIPERDDIQIIVVDDNSDDDKRPIIQDDSVEVIYLDSQQSKGAGKARNVGIQKAKGRWLLFADSDDFFDNNIYQKLDKYINSDADLILFKAHSVDNETLNEAKRHTGMNAKIDSCLSGQISVKELSLLVEVPWCKMIKYDFVRNCNITFDEVLASNDTMFSTKVSCLARKIEVSPDVLYVVTVREGSLWHTRKRPANYLARIGVYIDRCKYLQSKGYHPMPLLVSYFALGYIDWKTNLQSMWMIIKENVLFTGLGHYVRVKFLKRFCQFV